MSVKKPKVTTVAEGALGLVLIGGFTHAGAGWVAHWLMVS